MLKLMFKLLRIFGDVRAVQRGRLPQRVARRAGYRAVRRLIR